MFLIIKTKFKKYSEKPSLDHIYTLPNLWDVNMSPYILLKQIVTWGSELSVSVCFINSTRTPTHPVLLILPLRVEWGSVLGPGPLTPVPPGKRPLIGSPAFLDLREHFPHNPLTVAESGVPQPSGLHQRSKSVQRNFMSGWRKRKWN